MSGEGKCPEPVCVRPSGRVLVFTLRAEMPWKAGRRKTEMKSDPCLTGGPLRKHEEGQVWVKGMGMEEVWHV